MKNPSLDSVYNSLNKHILLAESYTEIKKLAFIIKACRLKPYDYFNSQFHEIRKNNKIALYTRWFDEYGNSVTITKNKQIKIIYGDLSLDKANIACTDLYYGLSLDKVAKISKFAYIVSGIDEDMFQNCALISMLGIDNFLRTYICLYGYWQQVSPLILGIKNLTVFAKNMDLKYNKEISNKGDIILPCNEVKIWLTSLPITEDFFNTISKQCSIVSTFLKNTKE